MTTVAAHENQSHGKQTACAGNVAGHHRTLVTWGNFCTQQVLAKDKLASDAPVVDCVCRPFEPEFLRIFTPFSRVLGCVYGEFLCLSHLLLPWFSAPSAARLTASLHDTLIMFINTTGQKSQYWNVIVPVPQSKEIRRYILWLFFTLKVFCNVLRNVPSCWSWGQAAPLPVLNSCQAKSFFFSHSRKCLVFPRWIPRSLATFLASWSIWVLTFSR